MLNPLWEKNGSVQSVTSVQNDDFRLVNVGSAATVNLKNGIQVNLKAHWWILEIWVPKKFKNSVEGLCGNYNDDRSDDFISRDGQTYNSASSAFKESWILDGSNCDPSDCDSNDCGPKCDTQKVARECSKLLGEVFELQHLDYLWIRDGPGFSGTTKKLESPDKIKMNILLNVMNLSIHSHTMKIVFLIFVKVAPIQPAAFSISTFQRAHLIRQKPTVIGQKN